MPNIEWTVHMRLTAALALGLLVGLERERRRAESNMVLPAGARTFTIVSLFGFACAWLQQQGVAAALPVGLACVAALCVTGYLSKIREGRIGWTSEIAALLTFVVGAMTLLGQVWVAAALGIVNTLLLSEKTEIEKHIDVLDRTEFLAVLKFLIVTIIVLPALPDRMYTSFNLNPHAIWRVVVLVSTVGFVGYFLARQFGARLGLWLSGLLGGMVSSTAVAISMGRVARDVPAQAGSALLASLLASSMTYVRMAVLVWIVAPGVVAEVWHPLIALGIVGLLLSLHLPADGSVGSGTTDPVRLQNPFELRLALAFAALFAVMRIATELVSKEFGERSLYGLAALVGFTDITPFVMTIALKPAGMEHSLVALVIVALMVNTVMKGIYFMTIGGKLRVQTCVRYGLWAALHVPFLWWHA